jgi:hypothetical protein
VSLGRNFRRQDSSLKESSSVGPNTNRGLSKSFKVPLRIGRRPPSYQDRTVGDEGYLIWIALWTVVLRDVCSWPTSLRGQKNKTGHGYRNNQRRAIAKSVTSRLSIAKWLNNSPKVTTGSKNITKAQRCELSGLPSRRISEQATVRSLLRGLFDQRGFMVILLLTTTPT